MGGQAIAAQPQLSRIRPIGMQRGTEVEVSFTGNRLEDAQELLLYREGVTVKSLVAEKANLVKATLVVAPDCPLGLHAVRVRTATGVSELLTFSIGNLPEVEEVEPNSEFETPQQVELGVTVNGVVQNEDVDYFVVEAKKGDRISAELEGLRLGLTFFDPYLAILNDKRFELARSDDASLLYQDPVCSVIAPDDGRYTIEVRESAYGGDGNSLYRLHVGKFPRPRMVYPAGARPGQSVEVTWLGDPTGPRTETVVIPADASGDYELFAKDEQGIAPSGNTIRVVELDNALEAEPNNTREEATAMVAPGAANGILQEEGDVDHFRFAAKKGQSFHIRVFARKSLRSPLDSVLVVRRSSGGGVGSNDDSGGPDSYYRFAAPEDDDYIVEIRDHLRQGGPLYAYRIEVTEIKPELTLTLPEKQRYVSTTLEVPRGNRMALMVNAARLDFGGELNLSFNGLPAGMSAEAVAMADNRTETPVLFSAPADAPLGGSLVDMIGKPADEAVAVEGHLQQETMLVRGQNNRAVWNHEARRMAAVVADEAPFTIEIVQPKAPLVRNGSMDLKILAKRKEGFTAPIAISMLYNPPGVGSSGSIKIDEGKSEATIPLTANEGAQINTWKIAVLGTANGGNGNVEVSTQLADLTVAESYFKFDFQKSAAEQGNDTQMVVTLEQNTPFEGSGTATLVGLPNGATAEPMEFNKATETLAFKITLAEDARVGRHKSVLCRAEVQHEG
jgi:hypothetical protein